MRKRTDQALVAAAAPRFCLRHLLTLSLLCAIAPARFTAATTSPQSTDLRPLTLGAAVTRELAGGQAHSYRVSLAAGQYLEAVVEQRGIDVVVAVFAPAGQKILEIDSPNGTQGPEPVWLIAETEGDYRIEVRAPGKQPVGAYDVRVEKLDAPTEQDRARVAALRAFGAASQLREQGTVAAVREAVAKYEESLPGWQAAGDRTKEAETLSSIGFLAHNYLGETLKARDSHERELPLRRALGQPEAEAIALNNLGHIYSALGEMQKALDVYGQSLALHRAGGRRHSEAVVLDHLGQAYSQMGQLQRALEYEQQALALFRALGEPRHAGVALGNLSDTLSRMGEYERALDANRQGLSLVRAARDQLQEAIFLNGAGVLSFRLGEPRKALDDYQQALALHRKSGNQYQEAYTLTNIGVALLALAEYDQALDYLQRALPLHRAAGAQRGEAFTLFQLGAAYRLTGKAQPASAAFAAALALSEAVGDSDLQANIHDGLALVAQARGDYDAARRANNRAIALTESTRDAVAGPHTRALFLATKHTFYEHGIDLLMEMRRARAGAGAGERTDIAALELSERASARSLLELLAEARADIRQGVDAAALAEEQALRQRLNARAAAQARLLGGKPTAAQTASSAQELNDLTAQLRAVETRIRTTSPRYAALTQPQPLAAPEIQRLLDPETLLLKYALGETRSYLWVISSTAITAHELPPRAELETAARNVYALLSARPAPALAASGQFGAQAAALSRALLGPAAAALGEQRLVIVADGALSLVPFAALPDPAAKQSADNYQPLLAAHEIVNLPSASVLRVLRSETAGRQPTAKTVAVLADPVFAADDPRVALARQQRPRKEAKPGAGPSATTLASLERAVGTMHLSGERAALTRLPFSREEAEAILAFAPTGRGMKATDFQANRATATGAALGQYRIVHLATHGLLNGEHPELSGLVFSLVDESGRAQDGFLRLHEIFNLKLSADLVVLSACQTGLGKQVRGEGLIGLTRGFMYAGAPRVVASLWRVDDLATAELMKRFYRGMLKDGLRPAAALRAAQMDLFQQRRWQSPYFWAAFTLQGDWR